MTFTYAIYSQFHANTFDKKKNLNEADIHDLGIKKSHKEDLSRLDRKDCKLFFAEYKVAFIDEMMRKGKGRDIKDISSSFTIYVTINYKFTMYLVHTWAISISIN